MTQRKILGEETICPECGDVLRMDVDIGDGYFYDICFGCGFKRKKMLDGRVVEKNEIEVDLE